MEAKGLTAKIPLDLHNHTSEEIRETESTMNQFIEMVIREHYEKGASKAMEKTRTLAFQVDEDLFQKVKEYLDRYEETYHRRLTQKEFIVSLIEQALEEAEEEFEVAGAVEQEKQNESEEESIENDTDEDTWQENESEGWDQDKNEEIEPDDADDGMGTDEIFETEETYA
ncbi:hypothetical protein NIF40_07350 [[Clostridium] leptum]|nr:hypothetical protein [[Clostridium] leptum]